MNNMYLLLCFTLLVSVVSGSLMYIGTESTVLYICEFNTDSGAITLINTTKGIENPSWLQLHASEPIIYTTNEVDTFKDQKNSGGASAYRFDRMTGALQFINSVASFGTEPAHLGLDKTAGWLGIANYGSGNYGIWKVERDFSIASKATAFFQDSGKGPFPQQDGPHAHEIVFSPSNTFVVIPDLGNDCWDQYEFDAMTGNMTPAAVPVIRAPAGSGPRHIKFHPFIPFAYGVSEIASTVTVFSAPRELKTLQVVQIVDTLPSPVPSAAAELQFSPTGDVLYMSNRITDKNGTISIFSVDRTTGKLTNIGYAGTGGIHPRFFTLSRDGRYLLVANQLSNNIKIFRRNLVTGLIEGLVSSLENVEQPSHILQV